MNISGLNTTPILSDLERASPEETPIAVAMLKKAQDQMKQEGVAMIRMLEDSAPPELRRLDTYA